MPTAIEAPDSAPDLLTPDRPFPGPKPYVEAWKDYYHGRESELAEVSHLIRRGPLAVLFGASGLGKTSLLNAGVFPKLREEAFFPFVVRLDFEQRAVDLVEQVMQRLRAEVQRTEDAESGVGRVTLEGDISCSTLWEYFKTVELWSADWRLLTPVVVFDQFEEAFTKGQRTAERRAAVKTFFVALRDLAENHLPDVLARDKRFRRRAGRSDEAPNVRLVLSLREDYLSHLEAYRRDMPSVMRDRFWLRPMTRQQALDTVVKIAPNLVATNDAKHLVDAIASSQPDLADSSKLTEPSEEALEQLEVEPSLLNLFCYQLNEVRLDARANPGRASKGIDRRLIDDAKGNIIRTFYADCLKGFDERVRTFVEESLISERGYRELVRWEVAVGTPGIDASILGELENRRLIRRELRSTAAYVELVHDVLVRPIRDARDARRSARFRWRVAGVAALVAVGSLGSSAFVIRDVQSKDSVLAKLLGFSERLDTAREQLQRAEQQRDQVQRERDEKQRAADQLRAIIEAKKSEVDLATKQLDAEKRRVAQAGQELGEIKQALADERGKLEASKRALAQSEKEGAQLLARLAVQQKKLEENQGALEKRKRELEYELQVLSIKTGLPP